jgi:hypothetical protein
MPKDNPHFGKNWIPVVIDPSEPLHVIVVTPFTREVVGISLGLADQATLIRTVPGEFAAVTIGDVPETMLGGVKITQAESRAGSEPVSTFPPSMVRLGMMMG